MANIATASHHEDAPPTEGGFFAFHTTIPSTSDVRSAIVKDMDWLQVLEQSLLEKEQYASAFSERADYLELQNVMLVPSLGTNLLSISAIQD
ncbi:hypothetical protein VC83_01214 [Pseudogymnoascus destructans]|uniref:Uncharacterized protein n=1 Tax=Pseudogymnoascus destructans TaxID=655981 RepID=A0A177ALJ5_9PEZI|nr:uncharacterized protein VC83_01214 [Pseudogymnoascus destructans]OAF62700.1 hypothetical protein VC83_01214 [Pseudogymnoascus destructans]